MATRRLDPAPGIRKNPLTVIKFEATPAEADRGATLFGRRCCMCHGVAAVSAGSIADLRVRATQDSLDSIVRQGAYQQLGMSKFFFSRQSGATCSRAVKNSPTRRTEAHQFVGGMCCAPALPLGAVAGSWDIASFVFEARGHAWNSPRLRNPS
jgi:hypothetical protein